MITRFKLFENTYNEEEELAKQFGESFIDEYFKENYEIDVEEIAKYHSDIWKYVNDERFVQDWIDNDIANRSIKDINDEEEMVDYIKDRLIDEDSVKEFLDKKRKKYQLETNDSYEDVVDELKMNDLYKLIYRENSNDDFVEWYVNKRYSNMDAHDILEELYGENDLKQNAYQYVENYVDTDQLEEDYIDDESYEYKLDWVAERIHNEQDLQNKLMEMNPKNSILLLDVMNSDTSYSIGDEYGYQKTFMEEVLKQAKEEDFYDEYPAEQLKKLNDKFGLANGIEDEYREYTYLIDAEKYNL